MLFSRHFLYGIFVIFALIPITACYKQKKSVVKTVEKVEYIEEQPEKIDTKNLIDELYKDITGFNIAEIERKLVTDKGGSPVYGEIKYDSWKTILNDLNIKPTDVLYDLGSGVGKVVIQAYLDHPFKKAVGVELSPTRHGNAVKVGQELKKRGLINPSRQLEFIHGDIADVDICDATVIYMCSTCYPVELMNKIATKCSKLKPGLHIVTLKSISEYQKYGLVLEKEYSLPMTWSEGSPVYVYKLETISARPSIDKKQNLKNEISKLKKQIHNLELKVQRLENELQNLEK